MKVACRILAKLRTAFAQLGENDVPMAHQISSQNNVTPTEMQNNPPCILSTNAAMLGKMIFKGATIR